MSYLVTICASCEAITDDLEHGEGEEFCEAPRGLKRIELFTQREVRARESARDPAWKRSTPLIVLYIGLAMLWAVLSGVFIGGMWLA